MLTAGRGLLAGILEVSTDSGTGTTVEEDSSNFPAFVLKRGAVRDSHFILMSSHAWNDSNAVIAILFPLFLLLFLASHILQCYRVVISRLCNNIRINISSHLNLLE